VSLAAINGPTSVVISGDEEAVLEVAAAFTAQGRRCRAPPGQPRVHRRGMDAMRPISGRLAEEVSYAPPKVAGGVDADGAPGDRAELCSPDYWSSTPGRPSASPRRTYAVDLVRVRSLELGPRGVLVG